MIWRALNRFPIAIALAGLILVVAVLPPAIGYLFQSRAFDKALGAEEQHKADTVGAIVANVLSSKGPKLYGVTKALKFHEGLREAFGDYQKGGARNNLPRLLEMLRNDTGLDMLQASDPAGRTIFRAQGAAFKGGLTQSGSVADAQAGQDTLVMAGGRDGRALLASVPIMRQGKLLGTITAGALLDDALAQRLADATGTEVSLAGRDGIWASSLAPGGRAHLRQALVEASLKQNRTLYAAEGRRYLSYQPVTLANETLVMVIQTDSSAAAAIAADGRHNLMAIAGLTLAAGLLLGTLLAVGLTRPLRRLQARALQIAAQHGNPADAPKHAGNEILALEAAFAAMTESLAQHRSRLEQAHREATEQSRELARREHEARDLAMVASRTHNAVIITDAAGCVEWVNAGFTRISGYTLDEVRGRKPGSLLQGPGTDPATVMRIRTHLAAGQGFQCEILNYAKDGREYWLDVEVQPVFGDDGRIEKFMAVELDITDRKLKEQALRQAEEFLASVVENIPAMVFVKDAAQLRYRRINRAAEQILGLPRASFIGKSDHDFFSAEKAARYVAQDRAVLAADGQMEIAEDEFVTSTGEMRILRTRKIPIHDKAGAPLYLLGISEDVTEHVRAQKALEESERRFRLYADTMQDLVFIAAPDGTRMYYINPAVERMWGVSAAQLYAAPRCYEALIDPEDLELFEVRERMERALEPVYLEFRLHHPERGLRWLSLQTQTIEIESGEARVQGICKDITEHRAQRDVLKTAKDEAEAANLAKSQFLANMSHEIRTPMNGVLGMTELLLGTDLSDRQRRFAETVYRSGEALLEIINDILDFSKIEAGKLELQTEEFALPQLIEEIAELLAPRAQQKHVELVCDVDPAIPPRLVGDAGRIRQVLINLAGNAVKFTEAGEVMLRVRVGPAATGDRDAATSGMPAALAGPAPALVNLYFEVRDTGIGMSADIQHRLFRVFEQGSASTTKRYGGTGLGLAISQHLVRLMGGAIDVRSQPGSGSTFEFCLSLAVGSQESLVAPAAPDALRALRGRRILVVEDNPTNRGILSQQLETWGSDYAAVESGLRALETLEAAAAAGQPYEVALIDMKMPGMSGVELAERIKRSPRLAGVRLAMLTSLTGSRDIARVRAAGIELYLEKPVRQAELRLALARLLGERTALQGGPAALPMQALHGRVLVVEDHPVNREIACTMLEQTGCSFAVAVTGRAALHTLAEHRFDLVLMDCQMPEMDGFEAVRHIRLGGGTYGPLAVDSGLPVIALTANALTGDRERCIAAGFNDYLSKPFSETDLRTILVHWLPRNGAADPALPAPPAPAGAARLRDAAPVAPAVAVPAPVPDDADASPLDRHVLRSLQAMEQGGAHGLIARLTGAFLSSAPPLFDQLKQAAARGDMAAARHAAHTLKSSNANVGALAVSRLFALIEADARQSAVAATAARLDEAEHEFARVIAALKNLTPA